MGKAKEFTDSISNKDDRMIAYAEYYYYTGNMHKTVEILNTYISSDDRALRYSAEVMGRLHIASSVSAIVTKALAENPGEYAKIISMVKVFYKGWNRLHLLGEEDVNITLSPIEITIAILYNDGWQKKEIAAHLNTSMAYVKKQIQIIYERLNIQSKSELNKYFSA